MGQKKKYKVNKLGFSVLKPDTIIYGNRFYPAEINIIMDNNIHTNPLQLAAIYWLSKMNSWPTTEKNPLALLINIVHIEKPDFMGLKMEPSNDMDLMINDLVSFSSKSLDDFLFAKYEDLETDEIEQEKKRLAAKMMSAETNEDLRNILVGELVYEAMQNYYDHWPPPPANLQ